MGDKIMKSRMFFLLLCFCLTIAVIIVGCAYTQTEAPTMPRVTSQQSKTCLRDCQAINANCVDACSKIVRGGMPAASQRQKCLDNCNRKLGDCYSTCE